jgi:hypothetical protein
MQREIWSPHVFAEGCGDSFLAMVDELGKNILSLFRKDIDISLFLCFCPDIFLEYCQAEITYNKGSG